jgi:hypothetical protein
MVLMGWELRPLNSRTLNTSREGGDVMRRNFLRMGSLVPQVLLMGLGLVLVVLQGPASAMISPAKPSTAQAQAQAQGQSPPHPKVGLFPSTLCVFMCHRYAAHRSQMRGGSEGRIC